jgi:stage V sporulation protein AE
MDYIKAFVTGGIICALVQILMEKTKLMPGRIMVLLVVSGAILGAVGIYEPFLSWPEPAFPFWALEIRFLRG